MSDWYESRNLETNFPELLPFLYQGANVLDVGCGPGTITVDVARCVFPGTVTGIDTEKDLIDQAIAHAKAEGIDNVRFQRDDSHKLHFSDDTFDITYARDVLHWLVNPLKAIKEQKRVTKQNGLVMAFNGDWGTFTAYPECPKVEKVISVWKHLADPQNSPPFLDDFVGRKMFSYFSQAGLKSIGIKGVVPPDYCVYRSSDFFEPWYSKLMRHFSPEGIGAQFYNKLFSIGVLTKEDLEAANNEIEAWYRDPNAFMSITYLLIFGTV